MTDVIAIENYLLTDIDSSFEAQINEWIAGVTLEMNAMAQRQLIGDSADSENLYDGTGSTTMMVDDFLSITSVLTYASKTDTDPTDITDDCYFYPANSLPIWKVEYPYVFSRGRQNIKITGIRGCIDPDAIPVDLRWAATVLVAGIINFSYQHSGEIKSESIGRYSVTYTTDQGVADYKRAVATIQAYKRIR